MKPYNRLQKFFRGFLTQKRHPKHDESYINCWQKRFLFWPQKFANFFQIVVKFFRGSDGSIVGIQNIRSHTLFRVITKLCSSYVFVFQKSGKKTLGSDIVQYVSGRNMSTTNFWTKIKKGFITDVLPSTPLILHFKCFFWVTIWICRSVRGSVDEREREHCGSLGNDHCCFLLHDGFGDDGRGAV